MDTFSYLSTYTLNRVAALREGLFWMRIEGTSFHYCADTRNGAPAGSEQGPHYLDGVNRRQQEIF